MQLFGDVDTTASGPSGVAGLRRLQDFDNNGLKIDLRSFMDFTLVPGDDSSDP
jgi:hypothetical protein